MTLNLYLLRVYYKTRAEFPDHAKPWTLRKCSNGLVIGWSDWLVVVCYGFGVLTAGCIIALHNLILLSDLLFTGTTTWLLPISCVAWLYIAIDLRIRMRDRYWVIQDFIIYEKMKGEL